MGREYLKCNYSKGLFSNEYIINFESNEGIVEVRINKTDLIPLKGEKGLVNLRYAHCFEDDFFQVGINDLGELKVSSFLVSIDNLVDEGMDG